MQKGSSLIITPTAAAELGRQASFAGTPGVMHLDLVEDTCGDGWLHIRLRPGGFIGVPVARIDGVTLFAPSEQVDLLKGLNLNYYGDLSGGGFLISSPEGSQGCTCGAGFRFCSSDNEDQKV